MPSSSLSNFSCPYTKSKLSRAGKLSYRGFKRVFLTSVGQDVILFGSSCIWRYKYSKRPQAKEVKIEPYKKYRWYVFIMIYAESSNKKLWYVAQLYPANTVLPHHPEKSKAYLLFKERGSPFDLSSILTFWQLIYWAFQLWQNTTQKHKGIELVSHVFWRRKLLLLNKPAMCHLIFKKQTCQTSRVYNHHIIAQWSWKCTTVKGEFSNKNITGGWSYTPIF